MHSTTTCKAVVLAIAVVTALLVSTTGCHAQETTDPPPCTKSLHGATCEEWCAKAGYKEKKFKDTVCCCGDKLPHVRAGSH
ncbi:unnamed protein product [Urochloa decumbens]|uniref:Uncharacterized protein n=1 Tax=Urochloa decumbens TaxID=240449 RepID=A0ABC9AUK5_9POAL